MENDDKTKYGTFYSQSKAETVIEESDIDDIFESIYTTVISNIQNLLGKGSDWIIGSVIYHNINISECNPFAGSSYIKLPKELHHLRIGSISIQNIHDNECFKWCLVRYLHPAEYNPRKIPKADKCFTKELDFKDIKTSSQSWRYTWKLHWILLVLVFLVMKIRKASNLCVKKLLWTKKHWFIINKRRRKEALYPYQRLQ